MRAIGLELKGAETLTLASLLRRVDFVQVNVTFAGLSEARTGPQGVLLARDEVGRHRTAS